jgi:hypothetical protein
MDALSKLTSSGVMEALSAASSIGAGATGYVTSRRNAKQLEEVGAIAEGEALRESAQLLARQRVAYAKAGVDVGSGTPLDVLSQTAEQEALSALRVRYGYERASYDERQAGTAALTGGLFEGATTALKVPKMTYRKPLPGDRGFPRAPRIR